MRALKTVIVTASAIVSTSTVVHANIDPVPAVPNDTNDSTASAASSSKYNNERRHTLAKHHQKTHEKERRLLVNKNRNRVATTTRHTNAIIRNDNADTNHHNNVPTEGQVVTVGEKYRITERLLTRNGRRQDGEEDTSEIMTDASPYNTLDPTASPNDDDDGNIVLSDMVVEPNKDEGGEDITISAADNAMSESAKGSEKTTEEEGHNTIAESHHWKGPAGGGWKEEPWTGSGSSKSGKYKQPSNTNWGNGPPSTTWGTWKPTSSSQPSTTKSWNTPPTPSWSSPSWQYSPPPKQQSKSMKSDKWSGGPWWGDSGGDWDSSWGNSKSNKSRKMSVCNKRLHIAFKQMSSISMFGPINKPSDVTAACSFIPPMESLGDFNLGCPFLYIPNNPNSTSPDGFGFVEGVQGYDQIFNNKTVATAFNNFALYCSCYQGYDLGCAAKIPHGPPIKTVEYASGEVTVNGYSEYIPYSSPYTRSEYCKLVGVWNGDFERDVVHDLTEDVNECGCYWIGNAKDMVDECPGVELGAFFDKFLPPPPGPTPMPTPMPTPKPVGPPTDATFVETFEKGISKEDMTSVLTYHVVVGQALSSQDLIASALTPIKTANGATIEIDIRTSPLNGGGTTIVINKGPTQAEVIQADIQACNGVIHIIDGVLIPPTPAGVLPPPPPSCSPSIVDKAVATPDLSELVEAVTFAELAELLKGNVTFTVFAPNNQAFEALDLGGTTFPNDPWSTPSDGDPWKLTTEEAFLGNWSIVTPNLPNDKIPRRANATLSIDHQTWKTPGTLTYSIKSMMNYPNDATVLYIDDAEEPIYGWTGVPSNDDPEGTAVDGWVTWDVRIFAEDKEMTWQYAYIGQGDAGNLYLDELYFVPDEM